MAWGTAEPGREPWEARDGGDAITGGRRCQAGRGPPAAVGPVHPPHSLAGAARPRSRAPCPVSRVSPSREPGTPAGPVARSGDRAGLVWRERARRPAGRTGGPSRDVVRPFPRRSGGTARGLHLGDCQTRRESGATISPLNQQRAVVRTDGRAVLRGLVMPLLWARRTRREPPGAPLRKPLIGCGAGGGKGRARRAPALRWSGWGSRGARG